VNGHDVRGSRTVEIVRHHRMRELGALVGCDMGACGARERDKCGREEAKARPWALLTVAPQLFCAPAAAHSFNGQVPAELMLDPKGGMLPPYHVKQEPEPASLDVVPLMYPSC
jgi:hypothetical protein